MATASIPLAKGLNLAKMDYPAYLSVKQDGVPVKLMVTKRGTADVTWEVVSRSGKPLPSVAIQAELIALKMSLLPDLEDGVYTLVAELTHEFFTAFKDIGGIVRKKEPQSGLIWNVFDYDADFAEPQPFTIRTAHVMSLVYDLKLDFLNYEAQKTVSSEQEAEMVIKFMQGYLPDVEGFIIVSGARTFKPNSRHWDYQKVVVDPMSDVEVVGFEEAVSEDGEPLGMVGRVNVMFNGEVHGVGAGKLSHKERKELWAGYVIGMDTAMLGIATIKHKRDTTYNGPRQGTFQHWRPEKTKEDVNYECT